MPILFGFPNDFAAFSPQKLFTAINSNIVDILFSVPGTPIPALTRAFGVIFTDVEAGGTRVVFFDENDVRVFSREVPVSGNQEFSFVGAVSDTGAIVRRVRIESGQNTIVANGVLGTPPDPVYDAVVMDDFLYGEPVALVVGTE